VDLWICGFRVVSPKSDPYNEDYVVFVLCGGLVAFSLGGERLDTKIDLSIVFQAG